MSIHLLLVFKIFFIPMIKRLIFTVLLNALALFFVQYLLGTDNFSIAPSWGFLAVGFVMGFLNFIIKPLLSLLSLPLVIITFGLFLSVINIFLLYINTYLFSDIITIGVIFQISGGLITYILASLLLSFCNSFLHFFIRIK